MVAPIYGSRLRLKSSFNSNSLTNGQTKYTDVVIAALKTYGMVLADGGNIPLTAADDSWTQTKWADLNFDTHSLFGIQVTDFEVVFTSSPIQNNYSCVRNVFPTTGSTGTSNSGTSSGGSTSSSSDKMKWPLYFILFICSFYFIFNSNNLFD